MFIAHINNNRVQSCEEHSINVASNVEDILSPLNLGKSGYICGLLHDTGKFSEEFSSYIEKAVSGEAVRKGSVIHTFAGVRLLLSEFNSVYNDGKNTGEWNNIVSELLSIAIGSHHGQFDVFDENKYSGFDHRMKKQPEYDEKTIRNLFETCCDKKIIVELFNKSTKEVEEIGQKIAGISNSPEEMLFHFGILERLLTSALIEGDRRDTANFMNSANNPYFETFQDMNGIWLEAYQNLLAHIDSFEVNSQIDKARKEMSEYCEAFAEKPCGIYRLNLPTGAGKTLSSLRYALAHAQKYSKRRIIITTPLLSILDQNVQVIREAIKKDEIILEHHSNVVIENDSEEELHRNEVLAETWESPIIVTTLVQLLNTMFDGKTSSVRRFHSLIDSIIIIDEVQSVPKNMISLFNMTLNFLSSICNTTFILCSATQPSFEQNVHRLNINDDEFVPEEKMKDYIETFRRNKVHFVGEVSTEGICELAHNYLEKYGNVLVVCNTKKEAFEIYQIANSFEADCYHLSTSMCMAHRRKVLEEMIDGLYQNKKIVCVSTQLIEAGVDISFGSVIRVSAGMDSIVQSSGRCNRNGEKSKDSPVAIVNLIGENLTKLSEIKDGQELTCELITEYSKNPEAFDYNLCSKKAMDYYNKRLYKKMNGERHYTEFPVKESKLVSYNLFDLLACNKKYAPLDSELSMRQAFKTAGKRFKVFDNTQQTIIAPYGEGESIINDILSENFTFNIINAKKTLKRAKEYSVNLYNYQVKRLKELNALYSDRNNIVLILNPEYYDNDMGVIFDKKEEEKWSTLIL